MSPDVSGGASLTSSVRNATQTKREYTCSSSSAWRSASPTTCPPRSPTTSALGRRPAPTSIQRSGKWPELWRVVGRYANVSRFDVESGDELHQLLSSLPLFPYMDVEVTALTVHPSKLES